MRELEIRSALNSLSDIRLPYVCVVPVRMQEAWLLFDENAIRQAAGNPRGRDPLAMPRLHEVEGLHDPKEVLKRLISEACGLGTRRRRSLQVHPSRVAELIDDFAPLRTLARFRAMEEALREVVRGGKWSV